MKRIVFIGGLTPMQKVLDEIKKVEGLEYLALYTNLGENTTISAMRAISNADTTPQIFIDGKHIGGTAELVKHFS